ncbi:MAG: hypothetical protein AMJ81_00385 [Phycisphaerae bacterium SM23_33]|jgi:flagellar motor protein MotB|nr:MAG: hypothetical protein AMJ81_00385 [Phycisphaerae bacterium SM23_33]
MMARPKKPPGQGRSKNPPWLVTFSDMVTLLLSFFVLLQSLARVRDPELFFMGQGSFLRAIKTFGLPGWLTGMQDKFKSEHLKVKHSSEEAQEEKPRNRLLDAEDESIREAFQKIQQAIDTRSVDLPDTPMETAATPIRFPPGEANLDRSAKEWLTRFALDLRDSRVPEHTRVHVLGLAPDVQAGRQQWLVSAKRAWVVADSLHRALSFGAEASPWDISSRGAGAGGEVWRKLGGDAKRSFIVIAIEGAKRHGG